MFKYVVRRNLIAHWSENHVHGATEIFFHCVCDRSSCVRKRTIFILSTTVRCFSPGSSSTCSQHHTRDRFLCAVRDTAMWCWFFLVARFHAIHLAASVPEVPRLVHCARHAVAFFACARFVTQPPSVDFFAVFRLAASAPEVPQHVHRRHPREILRYLRSARFRAFF